MSSETIAYQCPECDHAPFDTKAKLNKHTSSKHRKAGTFEFDGAVYPVVVTDDGRYACPTCRAEASSISSLRRHMGRQNCTSEQTTGADDVEGRQTALEHRKESGNENPETTVHTSITKDDCASLKGVGFKYNHYWDVLTCNRCQHIVDKSTIEDHLTNIHKLEIQDKSAMWRIIRAYRIRPHLAVVWDDKTELELELDDSDDEYAGRPGFASDAFRPGAAAVDGVSVVDGYKCVQCESALQHRCVQSKEALRTHYKRKHANQTIDFCPVRVQALYGRSAANPQLRYVEVTENMTTSTAPETNDITKFGIPANVHSVPGAHTAVADNRDMNQFGKAFFAYKLLEWLDLAELETLLHNPKDQSFEALKRIASKILEDSRIDTTAGFQVMLGKIMADDKKREYFHEVQEHETVEKYAVIWCKVVWLCCLAVRNECTVTHNLILTPDQIRTAQELVASLDLTLDVGVDYDEAYKRSMRAAVELSGQILRQKYGIVNRIDPDTGCSKSSSYIIPRAINLLSLRPNGSFLSYLQITHVTAAIRYVLRSVLLYLVMRVMNEDEQEDEYARSVCTISVRNRCFQVDQSPLPVWWDGFFEVELPRFSGHWRLVDPRVRLVKSWPLSTFLPDLVSGSAVPPLYKIMSSDLVVAVL